METKEQAVVVSEMVGSVEFNKVILLTLTRRHGLTT